MTHDCTSKGDRNNGVLYALWILLLLVVVAINWNKINDISTSKGIFEKSLKIIRTYC